MSTELTQYRKRMRRNMFFLLVVALLTLLSFSIDVATGPGGYSLSTIIDVLLERESHGKGLAVIVHEYRLPVALMAVLVGAMLATSGAQMQTLLNNPLAEPFTLGVASAASFGAAVVIISDFQVPAYLQPYLVSLGAFSFALLTCVMILILTRIKGLGQQSIVLFGIAIYFAFNALLALMQYQANLTQLQSIVFWMMGSLSRADSGKLWLGLITLSIIMAITISLSWKLTTLRLGEDSARSMGISIKRLQVIMLVMISLLAGLSVAFVGTVGFVGLVGPHIARLLIGEDQRFFIPLAAIIGALMMSVTSIVSKSITPGVIYPIGMITALIGVPTFISIIMTRKNVSG